MLSNQEVALVQPGVGPITLSVGFSMSIALHAATRARRLLAVTASGLPSANESHPMDHDSISSGHTKSKDPIGLVAEAVVAAFALENSRILFLERFELSVAI